MEVKSINGKLRQATLVFLIKQNQILLAMKKRGFGVGKYNGVGGKKEENETIEGTAKRETFEEIAVKPISMELVGVINFIFSNKPEWGQEVNIFLCDNWEGSPTESEEMSPKWFNFNEIPYSKMWEDDQYWVPLVLDGKKITGDFLFDENQKMIEKDITVVEELHDIS